MKNEYSGAVVLASAAMILCGFYNAIFNIIRRALHLLGVVRKAAELQADFANVQHLPDIAFSLYDIAVIFNHSAGLLSALQIISGISGMVYAFSCSRGKALPGASAVPFLLGVLCIILGAGSVFSLYIMGGGGMLFMFTLFVTQIIVPLAFTVYARKLYRSIAEQRGDVI